MEERFGQAGKDGLLGKARKLLYGTNYILHGVQTTLESRPRRNLDYGLPPIGPRTGE